MRVASLHRYPVKSLQGERLDTAVVGHAGIAGDRAHALRDLSTGVVLTARRDPMLLFGRGVIRGEEAAVDARGMEASNRVEGCISAD